MIRTFFIETWGCQMNRHDSELIEGSGGIFDVEVDGGRVKKAWSSGQMWRGIEVILQGRDPRDAWLFTQRFCGVCTTVHAIASVRAVEDALELRSDCTLGQRRPPLWLARFPGCLERLAHELPLPLPLRDGPSTTFVAYSIPVPRRVLARYSLIWAGAGAPSRRGLNRRQQLRGRSWQRTGAADPAGARLHLADLVHALIIQIR